MPLSLRLREAEWNSWRRRRTGAVRTVSYTHLGLLFGKSPGWARVTDVLPLYLDDVVSEDTKNMVEEHLKSCESCRREAVLLNEDMILPLGSGAQDAEIKTLKYLKKQFRNKKAVVSAVSVFLAFIIMLLSLIHIFF